MDHPRLGESAEQVAEAPFDVQTRRQSSLSASLKQRTPIRRRSVFTELIEDGDNNIAPLLTPEMLERTSRHMTLLEHQSRAQQTSAPTSSSTEKPPTSSTSVVQSRPVKLQSTSSSAMPRLFFSSLLLALFLPLMHYVSLAGDAGQLITGVRGGLIRTPPTKSGPIAIEASVVKRDDGPPSPTDVCNRWAHQSALLNGTIYIYGGQSSQTSTQTSDTWNNDFLSLSVNETWNITTPTLKGLPQPSGPPSVASATLWNSFTSLFLYGGEYSQDPVESPAPFALWEYNIATSSWTEHNDPQTSSGDNSDPGNQPVQNAAEGAGISVPELGRGWYFGGHQDYLTTDGWSYYTKRIYLKSLLEFTFPGYSNNGVDSLKNGQTAGSDGAWRNVTTGGLQDKAAFPERADGVLVYVPGFGSEGILLGLAGGNNLTFTELTEIDIYDIAGSTWYRQTTNGTAPSIRVNPCAVAASAADGSSINIYMFGGQNLQPAGAQIQYNDMWILTIPSFTWIKVDQDGQSTPNPRAGHTCNIWDGQIIVVGGYVGNITCDAGFYVFDASQLKWQDSFVALGGANQLDQQTSQTQNSSGLSGSYGYQVPEVVQSIIGGGASGGATITAPASSATAGPLVTGKPITYTITETPTPIVTTFTSSGVVVTETAVPKSVAGQQKSSGPNIAAIVAGTVAGVLFLIALYLAFCVWVYRRQLALYKNHVAMAQRAAVNGGANEKTSFLPARTSLGSAARDKFSTEGSSTAAGSGITSGKYSGNSSVPPMPVMPQGRDSTANSSVEDLHGQEPTLYVFI